MVKKLKDLGIIKHHHPRLPSSLSTVYRTFSWPKPHGKNSGLYKLGHGEKSVVWYWEFDMKRRYFHEFGTANFEGAMRIYEKNKFEMWEDSWEPRS